MKTGCCTMTSPNAILKEEGLMKDEKRSGNDNHDRYILILCPKLHLFSITPYVSLSLITVNRRSLVFETVCLFHCSHFITLSVFNCFIYCPYVCLCNLHVKPVDTIYICFGTTFCSLPIDKCLKFNHLPSF